MKIRGTVAAMLSLALLVTPGAAGAIQSGLFPSHDLRTGGVHFHSAYSDGEPGSRPRDVYRAGREAAMEFMFGTEHSEWLSLPVEADEDCINPTTPRLPQDCAINPLEEPDGLRKWDAQAEQAAAESTASFLGLRGFEWSSPVQGHMGVLLSTNFSDAARDGGATMHGFWDWFTRDVALGGGADGLAVFNHPGREPGKFEQFRYVAEADERTVGVEVFNRGTSNEYFHGGLAQALDAGWHTGAIGAVDDHGPNWGRTDRSRTVLVVPKGAPWTEATVREALLARRFYAAHDHTLEVRLHAGASEMGSTIAGVPGETVGLRVAAHDPETGASERITRIELYSNGGQLVASADGADAENHSVLEHSATVPSDGESWYVAKVRTAGGQNAFTSPIWVRPGEWIAGDLHVHSIYGHDTCVTPTTTYDGEPCEDPWTWSFTPGERIAQAKERGFGYLAITDHNNLRSTQTPEWEAEEDLVLVPAYENSLQGHAQMLGAASCWSPTGGTGVIENCDRPWSGDPAKVQQAADSLRAAGGAFQVNHPAEGLRQENAPIPGPCPGNGCPWDWKYGHLVVPDSVEVWNIPMQWQPPLPSASSNDDAVRYWESWLDLGYRVAATGGSDSHWRATSAVQGVGQPTTWVFVTERTTQGVLDGIRAGRTFVSHQPPSHAGARAFLEADGDGDGSYETLVGGTVPAGSAARLRLDNVPPGAFVGVVTSLGAQDPVPVVNPLAPVPVSVPDGATWLRAEIFAEDGSAVREATCDEAFGGQTTYCRNHLAKLALTSAIFVE